VKEVRDYEGNGTSFYNNIPAFSGKIMEKSICTLKLPTIMENIVSIFNFSLAMGDSATQD
jgi:hypothetical protein